MYIFYHFNPLNYYVLENCGGKMDRGGNEYVFPGVYGINVIESLLSSYDNIVYHEWIFVFVVNFCLRISVKCDLLSPTRSLLLNLPLYYGDEY